MVRGRLDDNWNAGSAGNGERRLVRSKLNSGAGWRGQETAPRLPFPALAAMSVRQLPERFLESDW
jgi:hypothetical protein